MQGRTKSVSSMGAIALAGALAIVAACATRREPASAAAVPLPASAPQAPEAPRPAAPPGSSPQAGNSAPAADLVAQGRTRFQAYKCYECHGANGEGTNDGPDLTGTHLSSEQITAFLQHPSPDARSAGMPTIAAGSPDLGALAAYVTSLKGSRARARANHE